MASRSRLVGLEERRALGVAVLIGLVGSLCILVLPLGPADGRSWQRELPVVCLGLPLMLLGTLVHVRRRAPDRLRAALRLFVVVYLVRLLTACLAIDSYAQREPIAMGHYFGDPTYLAAWSLATLVVIDSQLRPGAEHPLFDELKGTLLSNDILSAPDIAAKVTKTDALFLAKMIKPRLYGLVPSILVRIFGYSTLTMCLPGVFLAPFVVIQCWLIARRFWGREISSWVVLYALFNPVLLFEATMLRKAFYLNVGANYLIELLEEIHATRDQRRIEWRWIRTALLAGALATISRPFYLELFGLVVGYALVRRRISSRVTRVALDLVGWLLIGLTISRWNPVSAFFGVWLIPGPAQLLAPAQNTITVLLAPFSLLWPEIAGLFTIGLWLRLRRGGPIAPVNVALLFWMHAISAAATRLQALNPGKRASVDIILIALAALAPRLLAQEDRSQRWRLIALGGGVTIVVWCFHLLVAGTYFLD